MTWQVDRAPWLAPTIIGGDSGELTTAALTGGVPTRPGIHSLETSSGTWTTRFVGQTARFVGWASHRLAQTLG